MENTEKKISLPETILLLLYIVPLDGVGVILLLIGLDDFFILDALTFPVTQFYFRIKGVKSTYDLIAGILELIPYIGALPIKTTGVLITIWMANHPKTTESVGSISNIIKSSSGAVVK
ncbi:hypothetical protein JW698_00965 [Candidatus Wolfebacteria bacterium]|nr:hypothetical protein [Candidatus Wolfebacteria bacterium]